MIPKMRQRLSMLDLSCPLYTIQLQEQQSNTEIESHQLNQPFAFVKFFIRFCLFVWNFHRDRELLTHMDTSPLPVKGCKI